MSPVPVRHRAALRAELDALVEGRRPQLLLWVREYGSSGAQLVRQPEEIWDHRYTDCQARDDGSMYVTMPLWTTQETPSDLSVECEISPTGVAVIEDLHVL
jgi:hypothetical protein